MFPKFPGTGGGDAAVLIEQVRQLAGHLARPTVAARDRHREWDETLFKALTVPGTFGGGMTAVQTSALLAALGEGSQDPGLALAVATHAVLVTVPLRVFGTAAQRERYLPPIAAGEWIGGLSLLGGAVKVRAAADKWLLSGSVDLVALGPKAHHFLVIAEHSTGSRTAFLVDADTPGLRVDETTPAALRTCPWGRVVLEDCQVPASAVLGGVGSAATEVEPLLAVLDWVFVSAAWLGVLRALESDALEAVRTREVFDAPLGHSQSARFTLADLAIQNELVGGLLAQVAASLDEPTARVYEDAAAARLFTTSAVRAVTEAAADLVGPAAPDEGQLVDRAHRDARFFVSSGAEHLRPTIAAALLNLG
ncbi:acyl-CoA dehydrogenase family protein [Kribbella sp. NPDC051587]|uniref:acyl-CoA dehydrogenase family protein n=1 Tax=Kribbella sp. NPDC051587 TaxID=3364119 RepID=UPI0037A79097